MIYNKNNSKTEEQLFTTLLMMTLYLSVDINVANLKTNTKKGMLLFNLEVIVQWAPQTQQIHYPQLDWGGGSIKYP